MNSSLPEHLRTAPLWQRKFSLLWTLALIALNAAGAATLDLPESKVTEWNGFNHHAFRFDGRACRIVAPETAAKGSPWIWRARFFGHRPEVDIALLKKGFHVAYIDVAGLFGSPTAVGHWDRFYSLLVERNGFARQPALEGMSRGGLIVYNWAARNPDKVACIYADAPVCDFKSWPGGKGSGKGSPRAWQTCLAAYNFNEEEALAFRGNPIDNLAHRQGPGPAVACLRQQRPRRPPHREHLDYRESLSRPRR